MYKAYISISIENLWRNPETGKFEGCDPDTHQECGVTELKAQTLEELKNKISSQFFDLDKPIGADVQIFDGRIKISYEGEHDINYSIPKDKRPEQIPFIETASISIVRVEETEIDLANESIFSKIERC